MATIGRAQAVAEIRFIHLSGILAWLAWLVVHLFYLIGFENRLLVMVQWAMSYLSYERGARLITGAWQAGAPAEIGSPRPPWPVSCRTTSTDDRRHPH
jgi:NADH dehydrogenase